MTNFGHTMLTFGNVLINITVLGLKNRENDHCEQPAIDKYK